MTSRCRMHACTASGIMGEARVLNVVDMAVRSAVGGRGPAAIAFPIDIQSGEAVTGDRSIKNVEGHSAVAALDGRRIPPRERVEEAARILSGASKPLIFIGAGARGAGEEVERVAEKLGAPIVKAMLGNDAVPDDSPHCLGGYAMVGTRPAQNALSGCDAILIVGSSSPYIEFLPAPGQAVGVQIDDRPERTGLRYPVEVGLCGDAKLTLGELEPLLETRSDRSFLEQAQAQMRDWRALEAQRAEPVDGHLIKPDAIPYHPGTDHVPSRDPVRRLGHGDDVGGADRAASGAAVLVQRHDVLDDGRAAVRDRRAGCLPGPPGGGADRRRLADHDDGRAGHAAQHELPVKVVVMRNDVLGLIKWEQMAFLGNPQYGVELAPVDFVKVAEACGLRGVRIEDPARAGGQLAEALNADGPTVIEAIVDPHDMPMTPTINPEHAKGFAWRLAQGQPNREQIALTMSRVLAREMEYASSPAGVLARAKEKLPGGGNGHHG